MGTAVFDVPLGCVRYWARSEARVMASCGRLFALSAGFMSIGLEQVRCSAFAITTGDEAANLVVHVSGFPGG
jgi:hypothetical protein